MLLFCIPCIGLFRKEKEKRYRFNTNNAGKNDEKLSDYPGCRLPEELINLDYTRLESAKEVLNFYKSNCNK